jgi:hypothetical protein
VLTAYKSIFQTRARATGQLELQRSASVAKETAVNKSKGSQHITELMDSLALSEDRIQSIPSYVRDKRKETTAEGSTMLSNCDGLKLLDQSGITYEI